MWHHGLCSHQPFGKSTSRCRQLEVGCGTWWDHRCILPRRTYLPNFPMPGKPNRSRLFSNNKPWRHRGTRSLLLALGQVLEGRALEELALVGMAELALVGLEELATVEMVELVLAMPGNHCRWYKFSNDRYCTVDQTHHSCRKTWHHPICCSNKPALRPSMGMAQQLVPVATQ